MVDSMEISSETRFQWYSKVVPQFVNAKLMQISPISSMGDITIVNGDYKSTYI
jgi:hypothetical protein